MPHFCELCPGTQLERQTERDTAAKKNEKYILLPKLTTNSKIIGSHQFLCAKSFLKFEHKIFVCFCKDNCVHVSTNNSYFCVSNEEIGGSAPASAIYSELHPKSKMDQQMNRQL